MLKHLPKKDKMILSRTDLFQCVSFVFFFSFYKEVSFRLRFNITGDKRLS